MAISCGATAIFWPDVEACEAACMLAAGHVPADVHEDEVLGEWREDELPTHPPVDVLDATREMLLLRYGTTDPARLRELSATDLDVGAAIQLASEA